MNHPLPGKQNSRTLEDHSDPDSVQLTEQEVKSALAKALHEKRAMIRSAQYLKKIRQEPQPVRYSADNYWTIFHKKAAVLTGGEWETTKWNKQIINALCLYFSDDPEFDELKPGFSRYKGILLYGPYGCGKTTIMNIFRCNQRASYVIKSVKKITKQYAIEGEQVILDNTKYQEVGLESATLFLQKNAGICLDDIGQEESSKSHYKNTANVTGDILESLYYSDIPRYYIHGTTNADSTELGAAYPFLKSSGRLGEMFNLIQFHKNSPNWRNKSNLK